MDVPTALVLQSRNFPQQQRRELPQGHGCETQAQEDWKRKMEREGARKGRMVKEKQKSACSALGPKAMPQAVLAAPLTALSDRPRCKGHFKSNASDFTMLAHDVRGG